MRTTDHIGREDCPAELIGVGKRFGTTVALDGIDLRVTRGQLLALVGPNGAGKTTAIGVMLGLRRPDTGAARLFGMPPFLVEARRQVGVMMQDVHLAPELRVREQIDLVASYYPLPMTAAAAMDATGTRPLAERFYGTLSSGQQRQVQFAIAVCGRPILLFLDEPTVGLDVQARALLWATLRDLVARGTSIVLTTHYLEEAEALAHRVAVLVAGRLVASGSVDDIRGVVKRRHVRCVSTLDLDRVRAWPGVETATRDQAHLQITTTDAEGVVRRLMNADGILCDLEVRRAGLSEALASLTREVNS